MNKKKRNAFQEKIAKYANSLDGRDMFIRLSLAQYVAMAVAATSHDKVAEAFGISSKLLFDILNGRINLSVSEVASMAFHLGVRFRFTVV